MIAAKPGARLLAHLQDLAKSEKNYSVRLYPYYDRLRGSSPEEDAFFVGYCTNPEYEQHRVFYEERLKPIREALEAEPRHRAAVAKYESAVAVWEEETRSWDCSSFEAGPCPSCRGGRQV